MRGARWCPFFACCVTIFHGGLLAGAQHDFVPNDGVEEDETWDFDSVPPKPPYPVQVVTMGAPLFDSALWPLSVSDRFVVNVNRERVKFACVNWHGAYLSTHVVGGLDYWPLDTLAARIRDLGFNCVRLPYSTEGVLKNPRINSSCVDKNPYFKTLTMLEMLDKTIESLAKMGLMVIINNHNSKSGWCCSSDSEEGLWYTPEFSEADWIRSLELLAERYAGNKYVVGFDVRNEPHDYNGVYLTWGSGDPKTDWAAAAERAGNAILRKNPEVLIIVEGLCFAKELRPLHSYTLKLPRSKLVYSVHMYYFFQVFSAFTEIMSWRWAKDLSCIVLFVNSVGMLALLYIWHRVGRPRPPVGTIMITTGSWVIFAASICLGYFVFIYHTLMGVAACAFVAQAEAWPQVELSMFCLLVGLLILFGGCFRRSRHVVVALQGDSALCHAESSEDESSESETDTTDAGATSRRRETMPLLGGRCGSLRFVFASQGVRKRNKANFDTAMLIGLQLFAFLVATAIFAASAYIGAQVFDSWYWFRRHMDGTWGFVLVRGNTYTAPVWVSEFGASVRSDFWLKMLRYLSSTDADWAYWPLNPYKQENKVFVPGSGWVNIDPPQWKVDTWSLLSDDWMSIRHAWKLDDLRYIMQSPSGWIPETQPCNRDLLSPECGG